MRILLADDDDSLRRVLQFKLEKSGYDVTEVADGKAALRLLEKSRFDLLLSDIKMPKVDGLELLERAKDLQPDIKIILITAHATVSQAVQAVKLGAFDYITKPFDDEQLYIALDKALAFKRLETENRDLKGRLRQQQKLPELIGVSRPFKNMMALVEKVAATDATILLIGPSGTGKEIIARTLHIRSARSGNDLITVNCAAIPRELLESELFGHVKGAFTGAIKNKKGKFELADRGTLFLDEIGELALDLQAKLLRALQERIIEPVGSESSIEIDVRVIVATNVDLQEKVRQSLFRQDLYYRLNVIPIQIPSLRERRDDVAVLVKEFVHRFAPDENIVVSDPLLRRLIDHSWPGNVRELENLIERMVILRRSNTLSPKDLPDDFGNFYSETERESLPKSSAPVSFHEAEESLVRDALKRSGWNRTRAAENLKIQRHILIYRMKKYGITEKTTDQI